MVVTKAFKAGAGGKLKPNSNSNSTVQACHARMFRSYCLGHLRRDVPVGPA